MVFSQLSSSDKDAFFGLLDEYFASRPELFTNGSLGDDRTAAAASAVQKAIPSLAGRLEHHAAKSSSGSRWNSREPSTSSSPTINEDQSSPGSGVGSVAAAVAALSSTSSAPARFLGASPSNSGAGPPRPPLRTVSSDGSATSSPGLLGSRSPSVNKLVSTKTFGDVDTSSAKNMFTSLRHSTANKSVVHPTPTLPSGFPQKKGQFAPPPTRKVSVGPPPPPPRPKVEEEEEEEPEGEWAEVVYDYSSEDPGDLEIKANQRVLILEKSSEDWWKGELDGRRGLVPASYVKLV